MNGLILEKRGIFGGTFNPVHWGHLLLAETALRQFDLKQVIWVPTYCPPHKPNNLLEFGHRLEMVRLAIADRPGFVVSDIELERRGISYAIASFYELLSLYPNTHWHWLIGMDAFESLPGWQRGPELAAQCVWLVAPRYGQNKAQEIEKIGQQVTMRLATASVQLQWSMLSMSPMAISSSLIREYCRQGRSLRYLLPETVRDYIITHQLFL